MVPKLYYIAFTSFFALKFVFQRWVITNSIFCDCYDPTPLLTINNFTKFIFFEQSIYFEIWNLRGFCSNYSKEKGYIKVIDIKRPHFSLLSIDFPVVCRLIWARIIVVCVQIRFRSRYHFDSASLFLKDNLNVSYLCNVYHYFLGSVLFSLYIYIIVVN